MAKLVVADAVERTPPVEADAAGGAVHVTRAAPLTKRQKRKQPNDKHAWPQQPKISSPAARANAYLRVAGLNQKETPKDALDPDLDLHSPQVKFGRLLGSTDQRVRHRAILQLEQYLKARCDIKNETGGISELDLLKLWKGMWYTLYMADKAPVQEELGKKIARLIWCLAGTEEEDEYAGQAYLETVGDDGPIGFENDEESDDEEVTMEEIENTLEMNGSEDEESDDTLETKETTNHHMHELDSNHEDDGDTEDLEDSEIHHCRGAHLATLFVKTFFHTVRREWGKMDKYRVDKFYTLMRLMMHEVYEYMAVRHWNVGIIRLFNDAIYEEVLTQTPNGLRLHLIDLVLDEVVAVNAKAPMPLTEATFLDCLEPFFAMAQTGAGEDLIQQRVLENIFVRFLNKYSVVNEHALDEGTKSDSFILEQVHVATVAQYIFELASDGATKDRFRKSMYSLHKQYIRRLKTVGKDVVLQDEESEEEKEEHNITVASIQPMEENSGALKETEKASENDEVGSASNKIIESKTLDKKKRKRKKNKKSSTGSDAVEQDSTTPKEEEVTISVEEQKAAKDAMIPNEKKFDDINPKASLQKRRKTATKRESEQNDRKRVKFGSKNQAISWKESMKNLRTRDPPEPRTATPEKGILLNKNAKSAIIQGSKGKKRRNKAVDFF
jgi:ribosomal RNA-processing protein 1